MVRSWAETLILVASGTCLKSINFSPWAFPLKVGQMTQAGLLEHLKLENVSLSHQLSETQHRSIKEKERIALQLQGIEVGSVLPWPHCGPCLSLLGWALWARVKVKKVCKSVYICKN